MIDPDFFIEALLQKVSKKVLQFVYKIEDWESTEEFIKKVAVRLGRVKKMNEPDVHSVSVKLLMDW